MSCLASIWGYIPNGNYGGSLSIISKCEYGDIECPKEFVKELELIEFIWNKDYPINWNFACPRGQDEGFFRPIFSLPPSKKIVEPIFRVLVQNFRSSLLAVCGVGRASATQAEAKKEPTAEPAKSEEPKAKETAKESEQKPSEPKAEETAKESEQKPSEPEAEETAKESEQKPSEPEAEETEKEPEQKPSEEPKAEEKSSEGGEKPAEPEGETEEPKAEQTTEL